MPSAWQRSASSWGRRIRSSRLVEQFGSRSMQSQEQLVSLFYYMGMLTFGSPSPRAAVPELVIPNPREMRKNDHAKTQRRKGVFLCAFASLRDHFLSPSPAPW